MTLVSLAFEVELVGMREARGVTIGRRQRDDHLRTLGDHHARDLHGLDRIAERRVRNRGVVAKQLLNGGGNATRVITQSRGLLGMTQEGDGAVAEQACRGVVSSDDQLEEGREQLLLGQALISVAGLDKRGYQIVAWGC